MKVNSSNRGGAFHKYVDDAFDSNEINNKDNKEPSENESAEVWLMPKAYHLFHRSQVETMQMAEVA